MDLFQNLTFGFAVAISLQNLLYCFIGVAVGTLIGVLPGIGPVATIAMLLPITFNLNPVAALIMLAGSFAIEGPKVPAFAMRPLILISVACVLYGYLMKPLGLVGATAALVYVSAAGGHEFRWREVTILYVILMIFSWAVFVKGLTLPFPMWPEFLGY